MSMDDKDTIILRQHIYKYNNIFILFNPIEVHTHPVYVERCKRPIQSNTTVFYCQRSA